MDALIYTAMSGAERALHAQQVHANNLANLDTGGFRANLELTTSQAVRGHGFDARHFGRVQAHAVSAREGPVKQTGRDLDVAIAGAGYLAVQWQDGEAYTRSGALVPDADGTLTVHGRPVLGDSGPIVIPPHTKLEVSRNGVISVQRPGADAMQTVAQLKLVRPEPGELTKNEAGLIVTRTGDRLPADSTVAVQSGSLEGSNVSAVEEMVATMGLSRDFEIQMKLFKAADAMAEAGNRLIRD